MTAYSWRPGARYSADPQEIGEALEKLRGDGLLTPGQIVRAAKPAASILHPLFEWNDAAAAEAYRANQARAVVQQLRATVITLDGEVRENVRAFVNVIVGQDQGYVPVLRVMSDRVLMRQTLAVALDELNRWRGRYRELLELGQLFDVIDDVTAKLAGAALAPEPEARTLQPEDEPPTRVWAAPQV